MIYFDNSSTTPLHPDVVEAMRPFFEDEFGNASSVHSLGTQARVALEESRETVARYLGVDAREITFTSSGTEANNAAIKGPLFHRALKGTPLTELEIVTSPAEHHAVLHPAEFMSKLGVRTMFASVDAFGAIEAQSLDHLLSDKTSVLSLMLVNNELGAISNVEQIVSLARSRSPHAIIHTDAVQALPFMPVNARTLGVDMLTISAHKINGPKGIGALYTRSGIEWEPQMHGGAQERNRRGGTESVAFAVGFAKAIEILGRERESRLEHLHTLRSHLVMQLRSMSQIVFNSRTDEGSSPAIVNFSFDPDTLARLDGEALIFRFDLEGIAVSNGSACTSGTMQPSHVLKAAGKSDRVASTSIRASFGYQNTLDEVDRFVAVLKSIL